MEQERHKAVEARAYQLWEESGRAEGQHEEHWRRAAAEYSVENGEAGTSHDVHQSGSVSPTDVDGTKSYTKADQKLRRIPTPIVS